MHTDTKDQILCVFLLNNCCWCVTKMILDFPMVRQNVKHWTLQLMGLMNGFTTVWSRTVLELQVRQFCGRLLWQKRQQKKCICGKQLTWSSVFLLKFQFVCPNKLKGVLHLWALFLKTLCIFSKNKATSDKVSYGSGQKCSKELENYSFTSVETIVVKLQWKMCKNQYFPCFEPLINNHLS